jgi:hypothetical protein
MNTEAEDTCAETVEEEEVEGEAIKHQKTHNQNKRSNSGPRSETEDRRAEITEGAETTEVEGTNDIQALHHLEAEEDVATLTETLTTQTDVTTMIGLISIRKIDSKTDKETTSGTPVAQGSKSGQPGAEEPIHIMADLTGEEGLINSTHTAKERTNLTNHTPRNQTSRSPRTLHSTLEMV